MNKEQLDRTILEVLRDFAADCEANGRPPLLVAFAQMYLERTGCSLKKAIAGLTDWSPKSSKGVRTYLSNLPGIELFQEELSDRVRPASSLGPITPVEVTTQQSAETSAERGTASDEAAPVAKLSLLEEECRLELLRKSDGLSGELMKRVKKEIPKAKKFLKSLQRWAERGRGFRLEADAMVARGEDKTGFGFDSLKRDVRAHVDGVLSGDRRLSAAWFMLKPFFIESKPMEKTEPSEPLLRPQSPDGKESSPGEKPDVRSRKGTIDGTIAGLRKLMLKTKKKHQKEFADQIEAAKAAFPEEIDRLVALVEESKGVSRILEAARKAGAANRPLEGVLDQLKGRSFDSPRTEKAVRNEYRKGIAARLYAQRFYRENREKIMAAKQLKKQIGKARQTPEEDPTPKTAVKTVPRKTKESDLRTPVFFPGVHHPNSLPYLTASKEWTVLVDETGTDFGAGAHGKTEGKMVALFVPSETSLRDLPKAWHAVERDLEGEEGILSVADSIYSSPCGIVGITVSALPGTSVENQWMSCVEDILALGFRFLPVKGSTHVTVFVEQRDVAGREGKILLSKTIEGVLHRLAFAFPEKAAAISATGRVIAKDDHPWNGYADLLAYLWGSPTFSFLADRFGWKGPCFLDATAAPVLRRAMDSMRTEGKPAANDWTSILSLPGAEDESSLASSFLRALGQEAQSDADVWRTFLDEAVRHLDSKAIDMDLLVRQLRWLKAWEPVDADLPPRTRLVWLVSELAAANHTGRTDLHEAEAFRREFDELSARLHREDCPLCAHANLHLAVSYTNAFEFGKARDLLLPMRGWPAEGMGLRMEGRLLSSLGQHAAFLGDPVGALPLFDEAIARFRDLSEKSRLEILQTSAYAATASMDAGTPDADKRLASYLWGGPFSEESLVSEARRLAASAKPVEKYSHHILLRRLVELPADHPARAAYLEEKPRWSEPAAGHPWELIEFYRALLLPEGPERSARLESAFDLAMAEGGPTLQVIAAVIAGSIVANADDAARDAYANLVACCAEALPALGEARLAALRGQLDPATRLAPLDLARAVLPFNFR